MASTDSSRHEIPELDDKGLREFGLVTGGIVVALFGLLIPWLFDFNFPLWPWIVAGVLALPALIWPAALRPIYQVWMRFGLLMSRIMTPLVLGIVFFLVITPVSFIMKLISRDPMKRQLDDSQESYRTNRDAIDRKHVERPY